MLLFMEYLQSMYIPVQYGGMGDLQSPVGTVYYLQGAAIPSLHNDA